MKMMRSYMPELRMNPAKLVLLIAAACIIQGCSDRELEALGTLEWDRVNGRAVASEPIVGIYVAEGEFVRAGQALLKLDSRLQEAQVARLEAGLAQAEWKLSQLQAGYRKEEIASAEAELEGATIERETMQVEFNRKKGLAGSTAVSERSVDFSANALAQAKARERAAEEQLLLLRSGYRAEEIEQAKAERLAVKAELQHARTLLSQYTVSAERDGVLDSIPFKLGDRPPAGAVVSTVLAGEAPWARVYVPEPWLSRIQKGTHVEVYVDGRAAPIPGVVRHIESNASFTPYYTLSEEDRSRLSYVTEIDLDAPSAGDLPLGIPVRMQPKYE